ncbi:MAG: hypothetical protein AAFU53_16195 [Cyanobacteria bacterium J06632_3]
MEISTFELLVKRIAPLPPPGTPNAAALASVARRVVQGYFLTISNLEDQEFLYTLDFHISLPTPPDPDRTLANNTIALIDVAGANEPLTLFPTTATVSTTRFTTSFRLGAKQTASVQLLPELTPALLANPNPDLEVRGFVNLRLPAVFGTGPFPAPFQRVPQSDSPVRVLLNPEIRGTFLPNEFPDSGTDFDQINYPLELASGQGLNEIAPDPGGPIFIPNPPIPIPGLIDQLSLREQLVVDLAPLSEEEQIAALAGVIGQIEPSEENLKNVSDLLSKLNIPIAMEPVA